MKSGETQFQEFQAQKVNNSYCSLLTLLQKELETQIHSLKLKNQQESTQLRKAVEKAKQEIIEIRKEKDGKLVINNEI